jgi:hypothetical protein
MVRLQRSRFLCQTDSNKNLIDFSECLESGGSPLSTFPPYLNSARTSKRFAELRHGKGISDSAGGLLPFMHSYRRYLRTPII